VSDAYRSVCSASTKLVWRCHEPSSTGHQANEESMTRHSESMTRRQFGEDRTATKLDPTSTLDTCGVAVWGAPVTSTICLDTSSRHPPSVRVAQKTSVVFAQRDPSIVRWLRFQIEPVPFGPILSSGPPTLQVCMAGSRRPFRFRRVNELWIPFKIHARRASERARATGTETPPARAGAASADCGRDELSAGSVLSTGSNHVKCQIIKTESGHINRYRTRLVFEVTEMQSVDRAVDPGDGMSEGHGENTECVGVGGANAEIHETHVG